MKSAQILSTVLSTVVVLSTDVENRAVRKVRRKLNDFPRSTEVRDAGNGHRWKQGWKSNRLISHHFPPFSTLSTLLSFEKRGRDKKKNPRVYARARGSVESRFSVVS
jgi:hypothetical protein